MLSYLQIWSLSILKLFGDDLAHTERLSIIQAPLLGVQRSLITDYLILDSTESLSPLLSFQLMVIGSPEAPPLNLKLT